MFFRGKIAIVILLALFLFTSCYTPNSGKSSVMHINHVKLQLIDAETDDPIPNIMVHYYLTAERPIEGFIYASKYKYILIIDEYLLSDDNGNIFIPENSYIGRSLDSIKLEININIGINYDGIRYENVTSGIADLDWDFESHSFGGPYFALYEYKEHIKFLNENYYPVHVLFFYLEGKHSSIINQIDNTGNREIDFQSKRVDNVIYYSDSEQVKIKLYRAK